MQPLPDDETVQTVQQTQATSDPTPTQSEISRFSEVDYDENGVIVRTLEGDRNGDYTENFYNSDGNLIRTMMGLQDGSTEELVYDGSELCVLYTRTCLHADGNNDYYQYYPNGQLSMEAYEGANGITTGFYYTELGVLIREICTNATEDLDTMVTEYNEAGLPGSITYYYKDGSIQQDILDDQGNVIQTEMIVPPTEQPEPDTQPSKPSTPPEPKPDEEKNDMQPEEGQPWYEFVENSGDCLAILTVGRADGSYCTIHYHTDQICVRSYNSRGKLQFNLDYETQTTRVERVDEYNISTFGTDTNPATKTRIEDNGFWQFNRYTYYSNGVADTEVIDQEGGAHFENTFYENGVMKSHKMTSDYNNAIIYYDENGNIISEEWWYS